MLAGGVVLLFVDAWFKKPVISSNEEISFRNSLIIGLFQILSVILPGLSRSAATIIGGMQQKLTRKTAAEFSFFLAVPTLAGAFIFSLADAIKEQPQLLSHSNISLLALGNVVGFVVALFAIKAFINFLTKHGFRMFGWYRITVGLILVVLMLFGYNLSVV
jgi:undecaprenyl-diphosphatase